ncbi:MAG: iron ABC transporter permease [Methyloversatilis sp.]|jgi:iron complex transport system permease protein|uniref:FecCD family ABC transporter permease n=1 Tax=Methyloversatilis TaxID=378210 RepID=UPI00037B08BF|nr:MULTISPECIES: iron ABC transporter permease [Methyloversatilis]MCR6668159.1 iron ABC transporter permease [Methyloversatilis sp.]MDY0054842.1 iron ABC transporter permease [Methyloversatilis sp.]
MSSHPPATTLPSPVALRAQRRRVWVLPALLLALGAAFALALAVGSVAVSAAELWQIATGGDAGMAGDIVRSLRLPRALAAAACGGLLALAGALMQVLLRNPLADPYVLGISGGAAVGALLAMLVGAAGLLLELSAFAGALAAMALVFGLAHGEGSRTPTRLLLTGVIVSAGCGAAVSFILAVASEQSLRGMLFWLMGDASTASRPGVAVAVLGAGLIACAPLARDLNLLARGDGTAQVLGVPVVRLRLVVYLLASALTAIAVTTVGSVGFVGLVVPHLIRLAFGNDQRLLLPASALAGATLLLLADTAARTVIAPAQLPVGVLTALLGVPVFLFLLNRHR